MERRLAAILAADVVGYSRLVREDEASTLATLKAHREELIEPKLAQYHGRVVKLMGDGLLAEFPSAVEAVQCAVEMQHLVGESSAKVPEDRRVTYRMGINIGDIVVEDDDIYGDGVNIAARLESLAEPQGICISRTVFNHVKDKLDLTFDHLGEKEVKNIVEPVTVYGVVLDDKARALVTPVVQVIAKPARLQWPLIAGAVALLAIAVGGLFWWQPWVPDVEPASIERMAFPLPEEPSIAVLPFDNLGRDTAQEYLSDGLSENIITELSRFKEFFVIARNSSFTYKGEPVKVQRVAEELGVRYVVEGSVLIDGDRARVTAQLIDATSGKHLWAERYDRELQDIFAVQDEITRTIVASLAEKVDLAERERATRRPVANLQAYELHQRGREVWHRWTREANREARKLYQKAIDLDPSYAGAYRSLAWTHINDYRFRWSESPERSLDLAYEAVDRAVTLDSLDHKAHWTLAKVLFFRGERDQARAEHENALALNPNDTDVLAASSELLVYDGRAEEAISRMVTAIRLNPHHPDWYLWNLGWAQYYAERYEDALDSLRKMKKMPNAARLTLAPVLVELDRLDEARAVIAEYLKNEPEYTLDDFKQTTEGKYENQVDLDRTIEALRKAGLPEHPPLPLPDKASIAILPFTNMSDDPEQEYFADGMTDDLITDLSKISGLFVIARNSSFSYKGQQVKVGQVAEELGVRYVLEGSVRRAGDEVRINAQLIDASTGGHLWADRYDRDYTEIFALQDEVIGRIVSALAVQLTDTEQEQVARAPTENLEAYEHYLKAEQRSGGLKGLELASALNHYRQATSLDPSFPEAHAGHARVATEIWRLNGSAMFADAARKQAYESVTRALALDPKLPRAHSVLGVLHLVDRQFDEAVESARKAVALEPGNAESHVNLALVLGYVGRPAEASAAMELALQLDPKPSLRTLVVAGEVFFMDRQYERAIKLLEDAKGHYDDEWHCGCLVGVQLQLPMAYAQLGRLEDAKAEIEEIARSWKSANLAYYRILIGHHKREEDLEHRLGALRKAGLSEWPRSFGGRSEDRLDGEEIETLAFGQQWIGRSRLDFKIFAQKISKDGEVSYFVGGTQLNGTATVEGDSLCYRFSETLMGRKICRPVYKNPDGTPDDNNEYVAADVFDIHYFSVKK